MGDLWASGRVGDSERGRSSRRRATQLASREGGMLGGTPNDADLPTSSYVADRRNTFGAGHVSAAVVVGRRSRSVGGDVLHHFT